MMNASFLGGFVSGFICFDFGVVEFTHGHMATCSIYNNMAAASRGKHTIVLVQYTASHSTRSYLDFETVSDAMDGVVKLYEQRLKQLNPGLRNITYDISDLFKYIDVLGDLSCLVFNAETNTYVPYGKEWIKSRVFQHLKDMASR